MRFLPVLLLIFGFDAAYASVLIGHPVPLRFASGAGLTHTSGSISVTDEIVTFCDDSTVTIEVDDVIALNDTILMPEGTICQVELVLDGPILLSGTGNNGGSYSLTLDAGTIVIDVDPSLTVSSQGTSDADFVELAFTNWITATSLNLGPGVQRSISNGHNLHAQLRGNVLSDSAILR